MKKSLLMLTAAAFVCAGASAHAQQNVSSSPMPRSPAAIPCRTAAPRARAGQLHGLPQPPQHRELQQVAAGLARNRQHDAGLPALPINDEQANAIRTYLIASFPEKARPKPVVIDGRSRSSSREWAHADARPRPHDPLATPDGMLWWSGQFANSIGRVDPKTGEMKEYPIPVKGGPHGLIDDKDGNIWYGGNWGAHIGKLDVKTGEYKIYPMPDPKARDPHTPLFDKNGILWFSVQNGGFMGRLDPKTGDIKLFTPAGAPGQHALCAALPRPTAGSRGSAIGARTRSRPSIRIRWR